MPRRLGRGLSSFVAYEASAPVNLVFTAILIAVFAARQLLVNATAGGTDLWDNLSYDRYLVLHGQPWRVVSPLLVHAATWWRPNAPIAWVGTPGALQLAAVCLALIAFGPLIERTFGHRFYGLIFVASGIVSFGVLLASTTPPGLHGGSTGAVYGAYAAFLVFMLRHRRQEAYAGYVRPAIAMFVVLVVAQYAWDLTTARLIHIGGFGAGVVLGLLLDTTERPKPPPKERTKKRPKERAKERAPEGLVRDPFGAPVDREA
jgi:membrane associated rhomboid family serine protease